VFEDLHWIDAETQAFLNSLIESLPTAQLLLLVNYRPEYQHGWGSKTYYTQLRLDPLPPVSADELLQVLVGNDATLVPLKQLLMARAEGNPFFLEESVRTLVETGVLEGERGAYHLGQALPTVQVPATVQAVLAARIDRLPSDEKRLLQTAAVIGTEVPLPLMQAIAEVPEEVLQRGLAHLQAAEFLYETRLFPEHEYTFKHALTHEVAYGSLLLERRRGLHARLVDAIEALAAEREAEQVERLAHHAVRGEVWDKAVTYCQQAGARAHDHAAFREAATYFDQALHALEYLDEPHDSRALAIDLRLALVRTLVLLGEHRRLLTLLDEAEALARTLDDRPRLVQVLAGMTLARRTTRAMDSALAAGEEALALATALGESALQGQASLDLGQVYFVCGNYRRAAELFQRNVEAADREPHRPRTDVQIASQAYLAVTLSLLGAFSEGRRHGEEALRLATLAGRGGTPMTALNWLGSVYLRQGDLEHAVQVLERGVAFRRASGGSLQMIAGSLGHAYALQGRLAEGLALVEEAVSESIRRGAPFAAPFANLSEVCRLAGRFDEAWQHAWQALDLARQQKTRGHEAHALYELGAIQAHTDAPDTAQAEAYYQQALTLAEELGMRPLQAHCHQGLGTLYAKIDRHEQARTALFTAIEMYQSMEMTFWLPQAQAVLTQVEGR
jgi:tetratricopeptide (TPR) repeat protein